MVRKINVAKQLDLSKDEYNKIDELYPHIADSNSEFELRHNMGKTMCIGIILDRKLNVSFNCFNISCDDCWKKTIKDFKLFRKKFKKSNNIYDWNKRIEREDHVPF